MYLSHFRLERDPFALTPDPRFLFLSARHREALAHLLYGLGERGGFVQLTGEVGTGKTMLCRSLLDQVPEGVDVALILNPRLTALELVSSICDELRIPWPAGTRSLKSLVDLLNQHLLETHARGRRTVLVIDEAQQLSADVLEQVRLLTNLETATVKLLQIVLIGQPELQSLMGRADLRQLSQRVTARYHLTPLSAKETVAYIRHRLEVAGCTEPLFTGRALRRVHRLSGGVPRLVNVICDRALLGAYARDRRLVGAGLVSLAATEVTGRRSAPRVSMTLGALSVALALGAVSAAWWVSPRSWPGGWARFGQTHTAAAPASSAPVNAIPARPARSLEEWLADGGLKANSDDAHATLFRVWRLAVSSRPGTSFCDQAASAGLGCVEEIGDWTPLERYNRPASLELLVGGRTRYGVVVALEDDRAALDFGGKQGFFARAEIERVWTGRYTLLWKAPPVASAVVRLWHEGPEVRWIEEHLDLFEGKQPPGEDGSSYQRFDQALRRRVTAFQRRHGLVVDGRVGPQTLIQLSAVSGDPSYPVLRPTKGRS